MRHTPRHSLLAYLAQRLASKDAVLERLNVRGFYLDDVSGVDQYPLQTERSTHYQLAVSANRNKDLVSRDRGKAHHNSTGKD